MVIFVINCLELVGDTNNNPHQSDQPTKSTCYLRIVYWASILTKHRTRHQKQIEALKLMQRTAYVFYCLIPQTYVIFFHYWVVGHVLTLLNDCSKLRIMYTKLLPSAQRDSVRLSGLFSCSVFSSVLNAVPISEQC